MEMKKVIMLSAIMAAMASANAFANPATVNFNGNVTATSCTLVSASESIELVIPDVSTRDIADAGTKAQLAESPEALIQLVGCPASVNSVGISSVTSTAAFGQDFVTLIPELGEGKGVQVTSSVFNPQLNGWSPLQPGSTSSTLLNAWTPTETGEVDIRVKSAAVKGTIPPVAGDYATTYTLTFSWS